jgi:hypothetical protein
VDGKRLPTVNGWKPYTIAKPAMSTIFVLFHHVGNEQVLLDKKILLARPLCDKRGGRFIVSTNEFGNLFKC